MSHTDVRPRGGCPGSRTMDFSDTAVETEAQEGTRPSQLCQWPVQLHLVGPMAPYFQNADVLLVADCVAYAIGDFHKDHLAGNSLAIACPKLDAGQEIYQKKLAAFVDEAKINTLTVMTIVALIFVPIVLAYQGWTYWVFRERLGKESALEY